MSTTTISRSRRFTAGVLAAGALTAAAAGIGVSAGTASAAAPGQQQSQQQPQNQNQNQNQNQQRQRQQNNNAGRDRVITIHRPNLRPFNYRGHRVTPRYDRAHRAWGFYDGRTFVKIILDRR